MKLFVTGRSSRIPEVEVAIAHIEDFGHEVTFNWPSLAMVKPYGEHQV